MEEKGREIVERKGNALRKDNVDGWGKRKHVRRSVQRN